MSTHVILSSGEEPCRLTSHSHPGRSLVDSRHTLIRGGAVSTHITLSSREEPCRLTSLSHQGRRTVVFESMQEQRSRLAGNHRVSMKSHAFFNCIFQSHILKHFITIAKVGGIIMEM